jgi:hypothetical protein
MKKKYTLTLDSEFIQYCELNNIKDVETFAKETFSRGFTLLKYGDTPEFLKKLNPTPKPTPEPTATPKEKIIKKPIVTATVTKRDLYDE